MTCGSKRCVRGGCVGLGNRPLDETDRDVRAEEKITCARIGMYRARLGRPLLVTIVVAASAFHSERTKPKPDSVRR